MTLKEDGTATMLVELSGLKATLFADRLRFDMKWTVEHGRLKEQTIGGEPAGQVQAILKMMGDRPYRRRQGTAHGVCLLHWGGDASRASSLVVEWPLSATLRSVRRSHVEPRGRGSSPIPGR
jgi:hypothetical protein